MNKKLGSGVIRIALVSAAFALLSGCIGVDADIQLNADGSGDITLSYRVSRMVSHMGRLDEDGRFLAVPLNREDFDRLVAAREGIQLQSFDMDEDAEDTHVRARISFSSVEGLRAIFGSVDGADLQVRDQGDSTVFTHTIFDGAGETPDDDAVALLEALFRDYRITYRLTAPRTVRTAEPGTFSGRTAVLSLWVPEVLQSTQPVAWQVTW